ncbi:MAG: amino acid permease [Gemmatimonadetes bacterium]|nr:amino acid permease [Gemmatimonadota bacterium]
MTAPAAPTLRRSLGLWACVAVVVGQIIGSGIFRSPAGVTDKLPGPFPLLLVWSAGGLFALCGALSLAEVASVYHQTGGVYVYLREAWGRLPAFLFGWAELAIIRAASLGAISTTFAEYALRAFGYDVKVAPASQWVHYVAAGAIALTTLVNVVGVQWGSRVTNVTVVAKYGGLLFIAVLALALGLPQAGGHYTPFHPAGSLSLAPFGLALVSVLWAFDGWADLSYMSGEVREPQRTLPRALVIGTCLVLAIYLLANVAYLAVLPVDEIRRSPLVASTVAERLIGQPGVIFVSITVVISTFGTLNGTLLTSPRVFFAMADDGLLFRQVGAVHARFHTPWVAIVLTGAVGVLFVLAGTFEQLADIFVTALIPFYALAVASLYRLRRRPGYAPPFRAPLYPLVPTLFVLSTMLLLLNGLLDAGARLPSLAILGVIVCGIPVFHAAERRRAPGGRPVSRAGDGRPEVRP